MMKKMLIAIDGSESSFRAVEYAASQFAGAGDLHMTLLHVLPYPPAPLWDDGHIPTKEEKEEREMAIERWLAGQHVKSEPMFDKAISILSRHGIPTERIRKKMISDSIDVAASIIEETAGGGYQTLVLGRRGLSAVKKFLMGSVTSKVINHGAGMAVCIVE
jgi:nucleotide-binding universal stress UspA family protein